MNLKNLNVQNQKHKKILSKLNKKKISKIYNKFSGSLNLKKDFAVAVSGGPDSLALAYLTKCYSLKNKIKVKYYIVNHKLRKESSLEAETVRKVLKKIDIKCTILNWNGKKPLKKIQATARDKRYSLLVNECKKNSIKYLLLGHHLNDLFENFFIRIVRGSGLNGLISLNKNIKYRDQDLSILRPLLDLEKKELLHISNEVFSFFVKDPSNTNENYKRTRIRNLLDSLEKEGLDIKKLKLTIDHLKDSNESIKFYVNKNLKNNVVFLKSKNNYILSYDFFNQSHEVIFRSLSNLIQKLGKKYYPVRGKSINELVKKINGRSFKKITLGGCFVERVNDTILISKEI
ncbi:tRNA(Ile)-lysidine synthase [Candidatus Pelagibacter ubique]|uniref:tRNA(Ile)-lysidine synthase n=1 Tax=Pelagibacter ubique TaxID=198252 RepID=A0ABX1T2C4_PELUQ|nr:tRNA lysidine(34) synthetase TilS [Candidatus Pelagibacter ubique]NMN67026.1 tRNA(Ile)-lysidine synthase [Candidatus Pelagibacter ubique]